MTVSRDEVSCQPLPGGDTSLQDVRNDQGSWTDGTCRTTGWSGTWWRRDITKYRPPHLPFSPSSGSEGPSCPHYPGHCSHGSSLTASLPETRKLNPKISSSYFRSQLVTARGQVASKARSTRSQMAGGCECRALLDMIAYHLCTVKLSIAPHISTDCSTVASIRHLYSNQTIGLHLYIVYTPLFIINIL